MSDAETTTAQWVERLRHVSCVQAAPVAQPHPILERWLAPDSDALHLVDWDTCLDDPISLCGRLMQATPLGPRRGWSRCRRCWVLKRQNYDGATTS